MCPALQLAHSVPLRASGFMEVEQGRSWIARTLAAMLGLPKTGFKVPVTIDVSERQGRIRWQRRFGPQEFVSTQWFEGPILLERRGPATFAFDLDVAEQEVRYRQRWLRVAGVPCPPFLGAQITGLVKSAGPGWFVSVVIAMSGVGVLCRYSGEMRSD